MAAIRESILINQDIGLPTRVGGSATAVPNPLAATRYANVANFTNGMTTTSWEVNQWGDQNRKLSDILNGYRIVESIFTEPPTSSTTFTAASLAPTTVPSSILDIKRTAVMYSLDFDAWIYVNPATTGAPADQQEFSFVPTPREATRFDNLLVFKNLLDNSLLGDLGAWRIEQYVFTNQALPSKVSYFSGGRAGTQNIERAFVPFSKEKGQYVRINDPSLPFNQMQFAYTSSVYAASRFVDTTPLQQILDNTVLGQAAYGFDITQYYFDRPIQPIPVNPFEQFWCIDNNGPFRCLGVVDICEWICSQAVRARSWQDFYNQMVEILLSSGCYPDSRAFDDWWRQQDFFAFEQWLLEKFIECGGKFP